MQQRKRFIYLKTSLYDNFIRFLQFCKVFLRAIWNKTYVNLANLMLTFFKITLF